jgi:hypothetical protein
MDGTLSSWSITATWGAALNAAGATSDAAAASVTSFDVSSTARAALDLWSASGALSADQFARLQSVEFEVTDLPGSMLGFATWNKISIDVNAAGFGWFVDASQTDAAGTLTGGRMDLLSAIGHEFAHLLGMLHDDGLMFDTLEAGLRTFSLLDLDHHDDHVSGGFDIALRATALDRLGGLSFDSWMSGTGSLESGFSLNTGGSILGSFTSPGFGRSSGFSIFDEDGDDLLG